MKLLKFAGAITAAAWLALGPLSASEQGSLVMPAAGPMSMTTLVNSWLNPGFRALASCNWGPSAPANGPSGAPIVHQCWADTTSNPVLFKHYDGASWVVIGALDTTAHSWTPYRQGSPLVAVATSGSAADLITGTLPAARLPSPTASTLGGTQSKTCAASNWLNAISTSGVPGCAQPSFSDLLGTLTTAAYGANSVTNAKLAQMANGSTKCRTTAGTGDPEDCTAPQMRSLLSLVAGINVEAWSADLDALAALSSTGIARRTGSGAWSVGTAVANAELAAAAANTIKGNATGATAAPTDIAVPSCSGANQAINWTAGTGPGCATISGSGGAWSNTRLAKTAAYTAASGDAGSTIALGGNAFYGLTFDAPSGYGATAAFLVTNEDVGVGFKTLTTVSTSSTSIAIGTGSKVFTTSSGLAISPAQRYRVFSLANSANYMSGYATYASTTFTLTADTTSGSGTFTDWQIAPEIEDPGRAKLIIPQFASSATSITIGTGAKVFTTSSGLKVAGGYRRYRVYSAANKSNWMAGTAAYVGTTFTLTVDATGGSGTFTDWQIAPEIRLWPGQSRWVFNQNNVWTLDPDKRWVLPGARELCVAQNGSDSSDGLGLGSGCLAKIQTAVTAIGQEWDGSGYYPCNIGLYSGGTGLFNEAVAQTGQSVGCYLTVNVRSASLTWQSTTWLANFGDNAILIFDARTVAAVTLKCNTSNTPSVGCFYLHQTAIFDGFGTIAYLPGGSNDNLIFADAQGRATVNWTVVIGDGTAMTFNALYNCDDNCAAINVSGSHGCSANVTFGKAFVAYSGSKIATQATFPGCSGGSTSIVEGNSKLLTNGTTVPGGVPTSPTATGGRVCPAKC